tara:strand:- start:333 stop:521 length:189 start_codon:yes stop_codon:yes gene_type:complete
MVKPLVSHSRRLTKGEADLVPAFERAFAACKQAGLLVMVTTSHSAPCNSAASNRQAASRSLI